MSSIIRSLSSLQSSQGVLQNPKERACSSRHRRAAVSQQRRKPRKPHRSPQVHLRPQEVLRKSERSRGSKAGFAPSARQSRSVGSSQEAHRKIEERRPRNPGHLRERSDHRTALPKDRLARLCSSQPLAQVSVQRAPRNRQAISPDPRHRNLRRQQVSHHSRRPPARRRADPRAILREVRSVLRRSHQQTLTMRSRLELIKSFS